MKDIRDAINKAEGLDSLVALVASLHYSQTTLGRSSYVVTSKGQEVKTGFKVIDARSLIISNKLDGTINPQFPAELQPRDRTRMSSKIQVSKIAGNLRPAQLTDSGLSSHGAPIVGPDNVVESGNGRSMGILRAYEQGQADSYRQYLIEHAGDYGLKAADIEMMGMPVLVRERVTELDRAKFARDSNLSDLQEMAASEKAFVDAEMLDERLMALFAPSDEGNLLARTNDGFIRSFMQEIGDTATAGLITTDGRPTKQLIDRIQNAIFAKAYKDERLVKLVAEEPDPDMRNILTALNTAASDFAQMQMLSGDVHKQAVNGLVGGVEEVKGLDKQAIAALQEAINLVRQAKDSGQALEEVIAQQGLFEETSKEAEALALFIVANNRSAKRIGAAFKKMAKKINSELTHQQQALGDMFGGGDLSLVDVLNAVSLEIENEFGEGKGLNFAMFESVIDARNIDPYLAGLISKASSGAELIRIVILSKKFQSARRGMEQIISDLAFDTRYAFKNDFIREWITRHQLSPAAVDVMLQSYRKSVFYSKALREALENDTAPPSLADERNVDVNIEGFLAQCKGGTSLDLLINRLHRLDSAERALIPDEITLDEIKSNCRVWVGRYMKMPPQESQKTLARYDKKIKNAQSVAQIIAVIQDAVSATKKALADITGVMSAGAAKLDAVGLKTNYSGDELADAYISPLFRLKEMAAFMDYEFTSSLNDQVDFIVQEIDKIRDRPEKLKAYLKDIFIPRGGLANDVKRMRFRITDHQNIADELYEISDLFTKSDAYPPKIVNDIHGKVKAALDDLMASSSISLEQARTYADTLKFDDVVSDMAAADLEYRPGYDLRKTMASVYTLANGKVETLDKIEHQKGVRAFASAPFRCIVIDGNTDTEDILWHEAGHHIEFSNPHLLERAKAFLKMKAGNRVNYVNQGMRGSAEYIVRTPLSHSYMSKIYMENRVSDSGKLLSKAPALSQCKSTEIFSMALQCYANPVLAAKSILNKDGLIEFVIGCLQELKNAD
ncbi:hypothetical protein [Atlantibacter hermannii]|uniref:hypothetical protein n=1 Tax=Atlantibacter hermannii TaxID=565 RepID=UPI0028A26ED3|nr:hypothetical protein [Atlantibacter hermannii]